MSLDINGEITDVDVDKPDVHVATATGAGVDITSYEGKLKVTLTVGTVGGTSPTLDVKLQDSSDNSTFADITGATYTQVIASDAHQSIALDTRSTKKWIRSVQTIAGTSPTFDSGIHFAGMKKVR